MGSSGSVSAIPPQPRAARGRPAGRTPRASACGCMGRVRSGAGRRRLEQESLNPGYPANGNTGGGIERLV